MTNYKMFHNPFTTICFIIIFAGNILFPLNEARNLMVADPPSVYIPPMCDRLFIFYFIFMLYSGADL